MKTKSIDLHTISSWSVHPDCMFNRKHSRQREKMTAMTLWLPTPNGCPSPVRRLPFTCPKCWDTTASAASPHPATGFLPMPANLLSALFACWTGDFSFPSLSSLGRLQQLSFLLGSFALNAKIHQLLHSKMVSGTVQLTLLNCFHRRLPLEELAQ